MTDQISRYQKGYCGKEKNILLKQKRKRAQLFDSVKSQ